MREFEKRLRSGGEGRKELTEKIVIYTVKLPRSIHREGRREGKDIKRPKETRFSEGCPTRLRPAKNKSSTVSSGEKGRKRNRPQYLQR